MTWDDELDQIYIPITEADRPLPPRNRVPTVAFMHLVAAMVTRNPRCAVPGRLYDELRSRRYPVSRTDVHAALRYMDPRIAG